MTTPSPDDQMTNLAKRISIMANQLDTIRESGADPNSHLTRKLWQAIEDAADEIDRIYKSLP